MQSMLNEMFSTANILKQYLLAITTTTNNTNTTTARLLGCIVLQQGPLLFLIFVNDLPEQISSEYRLFAYDSLLYNIRDKSYVLQEDHNKLDNWSKVQQLKFSINKCAVLSVKDLNQHKTYYLCDQRLRNVNNHPYLGVEFSYDLKWKAHTESILHRFLRGADTKNYEDDIFHSNSTDP